MVPGGSVKGRFKHHHDLGLLVTGKLNQQCMLNNSVLTLVPRIYSFSCREDNELEVWISV